MPTRRPEKVVVQLGSPTVPLPPDLTGKRVEPKQNPDESQQEGDVQEEGERDSKFLFLCCQIGAESVCKQQIATQWPSFRFSFSRPGFLTYKVPKDLSPSFDLQNAFVRTYGFGVGRAEGGEPEALVDQVWGTIRADAPPNIHIWQRDAHRVGESFEPFPSEMAERCAKLLETRRPAGVAEARINETPRSGERVLDCIIVDPDRWWIGEHWNNTTFHAWPGGVPPLREEPTAISRAYYKLFESILWSRLPVRPGDTCVEIGSAPGGASQALLELRLKVIGVDPALMNPTIAAHADFRHIRKRGKEVRKKEFADVKWLVSDSNVIPEQTLDTVEDIVKNSQVHVRGMLITIKMPEWNFANEIPKYLSRIRSWGYKYVKPRHLAFNRQEICIAAMKHRSMIRTN